MAKAEDARRGIGEASIEEVRRHFSGWVEEKRKDIVETSRRFMRALVKANAAGEIPDYDLEEYQQSIHRLETLGGESVQRVFKELDSIDSYETEYGRVLEKVKGRGQGGAIERHWEDEKEQNARQ